MAEMMADLESAVGDCPPLPVTNGWRTMPSSNYSPSPSLSYSHPPTSRAPYSPPSLLLLPLLLLLLSSSSHLSTPDCVMTGCAGTVASYGDEEREEVTEYFVFPPPQTPLLDGRHQGEVGYSGNATSLKARKLK